MKLTPPKIPKRFQPAGLEIIHEDLDLIVGNKAGGFLTVAALWNRDQTLHSALNQYVRKGNPRSNKCVFVVHRLDQATTGVIVFAKTEEVQQFLKYNWSENDKVYYTIVHGILKKKKGTIESYLEEDEDYTVRSTKDRDKGKLARTEYEVVKEAEKFSLVKINLLTGKKNQIRVHMAELGHPVVGDTKYGKKESPSKNLLLHAYSLELIHPFKKERVLFQAPVPSYFQKFVSFKLDDIGN